MVNSEKAYVVDTNTLVAVEELKGNPLVGIVSMDLDFRSDASKVFADL